MPQTMSCLYYRLLMLMDTFFESNDFDHHRHALHPRCHRDDAPAGDYSKHQIACLSQVVQAQSTQHPHHRPRPTDTDHT